MKRIAVVLLVGIAFNLQAQPDSVRLSPAVRLPAEQEIALAKSAGPESVADAADIWILGDRGYERVRTGTNGYGCIVQRAISGQSLIPRCDDSSGVASLFPVYQTIESMRLAGRTFGETRAAIADGFRTGKFRAPRHGGFSYMYSVDGYFAAPNGERIPFTPHVMVYWPDCSPSLLGMKTAAEMKGTGLGFIDFGTPECVLIVNTPTSTARHVVGEHKHP